MQSSQSEFSHFSKKALKKEIKEIQKDKKEGSEIDQARLDALTHALVNLESSSDEGSQSPLRAISKTAIKAAKHFQKSLLAIEED